MDLVFVFCPRNLIVTPAVLFCFHRNVKKQVFDGAVRTQVESFPSV